MAVIRELVRRRNVTIRVPMSKPLAWTVWAVTVALLGCFFVWPILTTVQRAFFDPSGNFTLSAIREVFANRIYVEGLTNSFLLAVASTGLTLAIALPLAVLSDRFEFAGKKILRTPAVIAKAEPLKLELESFAACVREQRTPLVNGEAAIRALELAFEITRQINAQPGEGR